jgi:hypothetical protein
MKRFLLSIILTSILGVSNAQTSDDEILKSILDDKTELLKKYFKMSNDPNRLYGNRKVALLHYSTSVDKINSLEVLIEAGADINLIFEDETPVMTAIKYNHENALRYLVKKGADLNTQNIKGITALIMAVQYNYPKMLEILISHGANCELKDKSGNTALDYAYDLQNIESYKYLCTVLESKYEKMPISNYFDGPYIFRIDNLKCKVTYLYSDSIENKVFQSDSIIFQKKESIILNKTGQYFEIPIEKQSNKGRIKDKFRNVGKIMAIGDLHGGFDEFCSFLISNKIINSNFQWTFGNGHLVLIGDIFDRGNKVTECLWFIYKLENEAKKNGGMVHLVLGNHEIMELSGDKRYLHQKYLSLFNRLKLNYTNFYGKNSELGQWLRTKNTIVQINDIIFVHGGISIQVIENELGISYINNKVREIINRDEITEKNEIEDLILGNNGPFWYRGYVQLDYYKNTMDRFDFDENKLDKILSFYKVSTIVFANTNVNEIKPLFNFKLYGIDIPFSKQDVDLEGLYIQNGLYYKALINGNHQLIHQN